MALKPTVAYGLTIEGCYGLTIEGCYELTIECCYGLTIEGCYELTIEGCYELFEHRKTDATVAFSEYIDSQTHKPSHSLR